MKVLSILTVKSEFEWCPKEAGLTQLVLLPAGGKQGRVHFVHTIEQPVPLSRIVAHLEPRDANTLRQIFGNRAVPTWGVTEGASGQNLVKWKRMAIGDLALFGQLGFVVAVATVAHKTHAPRLAMELWGKGDDRELWEHLFFLDKLKRVRVPYADLNEMLGYDVSNRIQGFNVLDAVKSEVAVRYFSLLQPC